jgi:hypothetical protein
MRRRHELADAYHLQLHFRLPHFGQQLVALLAPAVEDDHPAHRTLGQDVRGAALNEVERKVSLPKVAAGEVAGAFGSPQEDDANRRQVVAQEFVEFVPDERVGDLRHAGVSGDEAVERDDRRI